MSSPQKSLKAEAKKFLSLPDLFPKGAPDFRKKLTPYQVKKIRAALNTVKTLGGEYARDITPMGKGRKKYLEKSGLPRYMRGIFLPGGEKINKNLQFIGGAVRYERGNKETREYDTRERFELDTSGDDADLIASAKDIVKFRAGRKAAITANGRVIGAAYPLRSNDLIVREAAYIFNKYAEMSAKGELRIPKNGGQVLAAHPSVWGMGVLFEGEPKNSGKGKNVKKSSKKKSAKKKGARR